MTVEQCYEELHMDYEEILNWFPSESTLLRYLNQFCRDQDFSMMSKYLRHGEERQAFYYADNFKDLCYNLGFVELGDMTRYLVGVLKKEGVDIRKDVGALRVFDEVQRKYLAATEILKRGDWYEIAV